MNFLKKKLFEKEKIIYISIILISLAFLISISVTQIMLGLLLIFYLYDLKKKLYKEVPFYKLFIILFLLMSFFSMWNSFSSGEMSSPFEWWTYLLFFIGYNYVDTEEKGKASIFCIFLSGSISAIYGIYQFLILGQRSEGFYSMALTSGNNWAIILVVIFGLIVSSKFRTKKLVMFSLILCFLIFLFAIIGSQSRGPLLFAFITIILLSMLSLNQKARILIILSILVLFALLPIVSNKWNNRIADFYNGSWKHSETSFGTRVVLWETSLEIIKENLITGIGNGDDSFKKIAKKKIKKPVSSMAHSHNSFLMFTIVHGIITFAVLALIYILIIKQFLLFLKISPYALVGLGVITVFLLEGLTEYNLGDSEVQMLFWFLTGLLLRQTKLQSNK